MNFLDKLFGQESVLQGIFSRPTKPHLIHKAHTLHVASGPGSIFAESEMLQLIRAGETEKAAKFYEDHNRTYKAHPIKKLSLWYELYKAKPV